MSTAYRPNHDSAWTSELLTEDQTRRAERAIERADTPRAARGDGAFTGNGELQDTRTLAPDTRLPCAI